MEASRYTPSNANRWQWFDVGAPAAGSDWAFTNGTGRLLRVISASMQLVTDANVANRIPRIRAGDSEVDWFMATTGGAITATLTVPIGIFAGAGFALASGSSSQMVALPPEGLWLPPGTRLRAVTSGIQVGDQWSLIRIFAETFPVNNAPVATR